MESALTTARAVESGCVEVRLRTAHAAEGVYFCDYPVDKLDRLVQLVPKWGVSVDGDDEVYSNVGGGASGQFRLNDAEAYFEIILAQDDA